MIMKKSGRSFVQAFKILSIFLASMYAAVSSKAQSPPYQAYWINQLRVSTSGGILTMTNGAAWSAGAISSNVLPSNTDGWIEFSGSSGAHYIVGLASNNAIDYNTFANAIFVNHANNSYATYEGNTTTGLGGWQVGDVFRISREGNLVKYYRNSTVVRSITVNAALELRIKACLQFIGKSTPAIDASFDGRLIVQGTVSAIASNDSTGGISLSVTGGNSPYTYNWSSGEQSNLITNKPPGFYSVSVSDATGRVEGRSYFVGHKINWINHYRVSTSGNILTMTTGAPWSAGAISSNVLPPNTDGWMEFAGGNGSNFLVGLASNNVIDYNTFTNALYIDYDNNSYRSYEGGNATEFGSWQTGDVFRISREGTSVKYYRNTTLIRSVTINPALALRVKACLRFIGKSTPNITTSFDRRLIVQGSVTAMAGNSGSGAISLSVTGGEPPYTYGWITGESTSSISNKPQGPYTISVSDAVGRVEERTYSIGYKINWTNQYRVSTSGSILTMTNGAPWSAGAISSNILLANTDGWMEFSGGNGSNYIVGLASNNIIDYNKFTNAFFIDYDNNTYTTYEGNTATGFGSWQTGDVFKISREGNFVKYYRNAEVVRSVTANPTLELRVKACLQFIGRSTPYINTSFWTNDGIPRTYYAIATGMWSDPAVWSLSENGSPSAEYPYDIDQVVIKGHEITINSSVKSGGIKIISSGADTRLNVNGNMGRLTVKGNIVINREQNSNGSEMLLVGNNAKLDVR